MTTASDESKETRQIRDAFIDGYLSAVGNDKARPDAERAWRDENVTRPDPADEVSVPREALATYIYGRDPMETTDALAALLARLDPSTKENA